jgi:hypothetical protein
VGKARYTGSPKLMHKRYSIDGVADDDAPCGNAIAIRAIGGINSIVAARWLPSCRSAREKSKAHTATSFKFALD